MADATKRDEQLHIGDIVQHKTSKMIGKVTGFARTGTDVMVEDTGPYPQADFDRLVSEHAVETNRTSED